MKRVYNGIRYDTDRAIEIGSSSHGNPKSGDFSHWSATLYRAPQAKRYFLAGEGGALTQFAAVLSDGMRGSGERIIPLSEADALKWAEIYLDTETFESHFGHLITDA